MTWVLGKPEADCYRRSITGLCQTCYSHPCLHTHTSLTTLIIRLVVVLEQRLPRVSEEGLPRDRLDEAKVGVVLDKDYSVADL